MANIVELVLGGSKSDFCFIFDAETKFHLPREILSKSKFTARMLKYGAAVIDISTENLQGVYTLRPPAAAMKAIIREWLTGVPLEYPAFDEVLNNAATEKIKFIIEVFNLKNFLECTTVADTRRYLYTLLEVLKTHLEYTITAAGSRAIKHKNIYYEKTYDRISPVFVNDVLKQSAEWWPRWVDTNCPFITPRAAAVLSSYFGELDDFIFKICTVPEKEDKYWFTKYSCEYVYKIKRLRPQNSNNPETILSALGYTYHHRD